MGIPKDIDSVVLIFRGQVFYESEAAIEVARQLQFPWYLAGAFRIIPLGWRNRIYRWIARNRYRWFGKRTTCRIPTKKEQRFFPGMEELDF